MRFIAINFIYKYILIIYINIYRAPMGTILIFIFYNFIFLFFVLVVVWGSEIMSSEGRLTKNLQKLRRE